MPPKRVHERATTRPGLDGRGEPQNVNYDDCSIADGFDSGGSPFEPNVEAALSCPRGCQHFSIMAGTTRSGPRFKHQDVLGPRLGRGRL